MEKRIESYIVSLAQAERALRIAEHIRHVTLPLLKETKLIIKIFTETYLSLMHSINAILQYESYMKRISIKHNSAINMNIFGEKCAARYGISEEQLSNFREMTALAEVHKKSPFEFTKHDKIVMITDNSRVHTLDTAKVMRFLDMAREVYSKAYNGIKNM